QELQSVPDTLDIMTTLSTAGCPTCSGMSTTPCKQRACTLKSTSSIYDGFTPTPSGTFVLDVCSWPSLLGGDRALFADPVQSLTIDDLAPMYSGDEYTCVQIVSAAGFAFNSTKKDLTYCADHVESNGDACAGPVPLSIPPQSDPGHPGNQI